VGTDGHRKMSKSLHNEIGVTDTPEEMFGKAMKIPDEALAEYNQLLLDQTAPLSRAAAGDAGKKLRVPSGVEARDAKRALARGLVSWLHSEEDAQAAERHFERVIVEGEAPEQIEDAVVSSDNGIVHLPGLIAEQFGISRSEARRLIDQGGVVLGDSRLAAGEHDVPLGRADGQLLKVGKRRFRRLRAP
jgi:tyrosyl-tRNA synthetase